MALPPGSVFKSLTATALLESGLVPDGHSIACRGFLDRPSHHRCYVFSRFGVGHGKTNLGDALCRSCNVFFFDAARRLARSGPTGHNNLHLWAERFGFGHPTGIDLPGESSGDLPAPPTRPLISETMQLAIGQGPVTATPLQIVRMMAAIANGGSLVTPHVVSGHGPDAAALATRADPRATRIANLSPRTLAIVQNGLRRVVEDPLGTGYKRIRLPEMAIAGKTGTAEVGGDLEDHAWFAGYVPADRPRLAFVVVLEHAGSGGRQAGPVARQLVQSMQAHGLIGPATRVSLSDKPAR
jgi:penicillin-binding protein 2